MRVRPQSLARLTWPVLALVFVGLLGGFHPPDRTRDIVVVVAAALVVLLNAPAIVELASPHDGRARHGLALVLRLAAAALVLTFVRGISHERADWHAKDAWRRCSPGATWPADPEARCRVLHMCANESAMDRADLDARVAATPGCPAL